MSSAADFLQRAASLMDERGRQYDQPEGERSMARAVEAFNAITGKSLNEAEGWLLLQVLKDVRQWQRPAYHADSAEDCVAYSALKAEALKRADVVARALGNHPDDDLVGLVGIPVDLLGGDGNERHRIGQFASSLRLKIGAAGYNSGIPNISEQRRQDAAAEDEDFAAVEARMDVIGQNGNDGEHYDARASCPACYGAGRVYVDPGRTSAGIVPCPRCRP